MGLPVAGTSCRCDLTVLRLPPLHLPLGLEGGDDVLDEVAGGVVVLIVRLPRVTRETFLILLTDDDTSKHTDQ